MDQSRNRAYLRIAGACLLLAGLLVAAIVLPADAQPTDPQELNATKCTFITNVSLANSSEEIFAANKNRVEFCIFIDPANAVVTHIDHFGGTAETTDADFPANTFSSICDDLADGRITKTAINGRSASSTAAISGWECSR